MTTYIALAVMIFSIVSPSSYNYTKVTLPTPTAEIDCVNENCFFNAEGFESFDCYSYSGVVGYPGQVCDCTCNEEEVAVCRCEWEWSSFGYNE